MALNASQKNLQTFFNKLDDFLFILNSKGQILHFNPVVEKRLGYSAQELSCMAVVDVHPPELRTEAESIINEMLVGKLSVCPIPLMTKNGELIPVETKVTRGYWDNQEVLFGISRDITERKQAEEALQKAYDELEKRVEERTVELKKTNILLKQEINERKKTEEIIKRYVSDLTFLSNATMGFVKLLPEQDIYQFIGEQLKILVGDSIVLINSFNSATESFRIRAMIGVGKHLKSIINVLGKNPNEFSFTLNDEEARTGLKSGKLTKVPGGLYDFSFRKIPKSTCQFLEKSLGLGNIYVMSFTQKNEIFGGAGILTRKGTELKNQNIIETFINQASVALQRKQAEDQITASLKEKEVLLKEIHHRVKNNLQVISSLLYLQSKIIKDPETLKMFKDSQNRIQSIVMIHEKLYKSKDFARINFAEYLKNLAKQLLHSYNVNLNAIKLDVKVEDISLGIDTAIPCGMIINELISNSLQHAFPTGKTGEIHVELYSKTSKKIILIVSDNGIGFPKNLDFKNTKSLGLQLVCSLVEQLNGNIKLNKRNGTQFRIIFTNLKNKKWGE